MNNKIEIKVNKVLKLTNALIQDVDIKCDNRNVEHSIIQMDNYIKSKGVTPIGPLIQKTEYSVNDEGQIDIKVYLMRQANNFIHNVEAPYTMESVLRVRNCMYARYTGGKTILEFLAFGRKAAAFLKGSVKDGGPSQISIKMTQKNFENY